MPTSATPGHLDNTLRLFAQCLAFVQPFNSLHWLDCKHQPAAEVASFGRHPTIQGLGCLEMGADAANIVDMSFPLHCSDPCHCGRDGEFGTETLTEK